METNAPEQSIAQMEPMTPPEPDNPPPADPEVAGIEKPQPKNEPPPEPIKEAAETPLEQPEYTPNYQYKVAQKELEFDERLRAIIKDKDSEDYVRDLVTRAEGLEHVKQRLSEKDANANDLQSRFNEVQTKTTQYETGLQRLNELAQSDLHSFQKAWNIPDEQIIQLAKNIIEASENPQLARQQQQAFDNHMQRWQHEDQRSVQQQSYDHQVQEMHNMRMEMAMSKPKVEEFQNSLNATMGDGFFEKKVKEYGTLMHHQNIYVEPKEAVQHVMNEYETFLKARENSTTVAETASGHGKSPEVVKDTAPIRNIGPGRTGSPVKQKPSWDYLKKLAGGIAT